MEGSKGGLRAYRLPPGRYGTAGAASGRRKALGERRLGRQQGMVSRVLVCCPGPAEEWTAPGQRARPACLPLPPFARQDWPHHPRSHPSLFSQARPLLHAAGSQAAWPPTRTDVRVRVQVVPQPRLAALQRAIYLDGVVLRQAGGGRAAAAHITYARAEHGGAQKHRRRRHPSAQKHRWRQLTNWFSWSNSALIFSCCSRKCRGPACKQRSMWRVRPPPRRPADPGLAAPSSCALTST